MTFEWNRRLISYHVDCFASFRYDIRLALTQSAVTTHRTERTLHRCAIHSLRREIRYPLSPPDGRSAIHRTGTVRIALRSVFLLTAPL